MKSGQELSEHNKAENFAADLIVGKSQPMQKVLDMVQQVALYPTTTILLQGESGTGKDVIARTIHQKSGCQPSQFVAINCAAIPETLLETELFGVEEGAYTDARASRDGLIAFANHGTLFLDEISSMPLSLQAKILRFLETRHFCRVGGTKEHMVDLRVISATNVDLHTAVSKKNFRSDLFYRLKVITIDLPPLRKRSDDIVLLIDHFLHQFNAQRDEAICVSNEALELLCGYSWPGNIRELMHVLERGLILCKNNLIMPQDLPEYILHAETVSLRSLLETQQQLHLPDEGINLTNFLSTIEASFIHEAMSRCAGNQVHAASLLGISRDQLRYRLRLLQKPSLSS